MNTVEWIVRIFVISGFAYWLVQLMLVDEIRRAVPDLASIDAPEPEHWPRVSAIVPAHNEGPAVAAAIDSRLADDYPNLELVLIDDRSTDETSVIFREKAAADPRVKAVRIDELPEFWWGKTHAMQAALPVATGEWLLLSDSDVHVAPGALRRAIAYCEAHGIDHLTVLAECWRSTFSLDAIFSAALKFVFMGARLWGVAQPRSSASGGQGPFSLIRRSAFERTPGLEHIRLEVTEDYAIGKMLKQSGAKCAVLNGRTLVGLPWMANLAKYCASSDRSVYAYWGGYSLIRVVLLALAMLVYELFPLILLLLLPYGLPQPFLLVMFAFFLAARVQILINAWNGRPLWPCLLHPLGTVLNVWVLLRAGWHGYRSGGVRWGGVFYPYSVLKEYRRM